MKFLAANFCKPVPPVWVLLQPIQIFLLTIGFENADQIKDVVNRVNGILRG
jgi:hypothetical protein